MNRISNSLRPFLRKVSGNKSTMAVTKLSTQTNCGRNLIRTPRFHRLSFSNFLPPLLSVSSNKGLASVASQLHLPLATQSWQTLGWVYGTQLQNTVSHTLAIASKLEDLGRSLPVHSRYQKDWKPCRKVLSMGRAHH